MKRDLELDAMASVTTALKELDEQTAARVLRWALDRFHVSTKENKEANGEEEPGLNFKELPVLYDAANPTTDAEKTLVVGYWLQQIEENENFDAQSVNSKLKHLGHRVGNITRAFDALKDENPRLVLQIEKSGSTKQARKKFKLTVEGIRKVKNMLNQKAFQQR